MKASAYTRTGCDLGFSYIEVVIATLVLALALVPAMEALRTGILGAEVHESVASDHYHLIEGIEQVLVAPYGTLDAAALSAASPTTPTIYSDPPGTPRRRLLFLARYDAATSSFTGADTGLLWVRVAYEKRNGEFSTLTAR